MNQTQDRSETTACTLALEAVQAYREKTFRSNPSRRLTQLNQAVDFVNERGFVFLYAIKDVVLPSLWVAAAGDRPVPKEHNDPGQIVWDWKDRSLGKKRWHYARFLHRRNTLISLAVLPHFYALSPNYGEPEIDYLDQYEQGLMTRESKQVYEALLKFGPMDTLALREAAQMTAADSYGRFNKALEDLQRELKILPVGISEAGAWNYAFIFDLVHRHYPDLIAQAGEITEPQARDTLLEIYFNSVGAVPARQIPKLTGWRPEDIQRALKRLEEREILCTGVQVPEQKDGWISLTSLVDA